MLILKSLSKMCALQKETVFLDDVDNHNAHCSFPRSTGMSTMTWQKNSSRIFGFLPSRGPAHCEGLFWTVCHVSHDSEFSKNNLDTDV